MPALRVRRKVVSSACNRLFSTYTYQKITLIPVCGEISYETHLENDLGRKVYASNAKGLLETAKIALELYSVISVSAYRIVVS